MVLFTDGVLKTLHISKFNSCINGTDAQLKLFPGCNTVQLDHHTIPIWQEQYCDATGIHLGINNLLISSSEKSIYKTFEDFNKIALRYRRYNIVTIFIPSKSLVTPQFKWFIV